MEYRKVIIIILLLFSSLFPADYAQAAPDERLALIIGNSNYSSGPLKNPVNDASDIAVSLRSLGFSVMLKQNATIREMESAIRDFGNRLRKGGVGLFYFAGHGIQVNGINYLVPVEAKISRESDIKYAAVDAGKVLDAMSDASSGVNIVILDACRDNPFARQFRSLSRGLAIVSDAPRGTYISYSTGPGQLALDGDGRNSPFAAAFMKFMKEPGWTIEQVFKKIRHQLNMETGGKQIPWELSSLEGDFFFATGSGRKTLSLRETSGSENNFAQKVEAPEFKASPIEASIKDETTGMEFIGVPGGCFLMGDSFGDGPAAEKPLHEVCLDSFYLGKYEVTQGQWKRIMGTNPSHFKSCGDNCPVESISWFDAQSFIAELNKVSGIKYRLPTEAEWEYAARDGGKAEKWAGTSAEGKLGDYAWYEATADDRMHPIGRKIPNALGFHDMTGNVWEWTNDFYADAYYQQSPRDNPTGSEGGENRVLRGGCWMDRKQDIRSSQRFFFAPGSIFKTIGLRLVRPVNHNR